eukprot:357240-Chlamydomonas_euryale.AAC.7
MPGMCLLPGPLGYAAVGTWFAMWGFGVRVTEGHDPGLGRAAESLKGAVTEHHSAALTLEKACTRQGCMRGQCPEGRQGCLLLHSGCLLADLKVLRICCMCWGVRPVPPCLDITWQRIRNITWQRIRNITWQRIRNITWQRIRNTARQMGACVQIYHAVRA